jgi:hypothetical protein
MTAATVNSLITQYRDILPRRFYRRNQLSTHANTTRFFRKLFK